MLELIHPRETPAVGRWPAGLGHERDGVRLRVRTPGKSATVQLLRFRRVAPGPGQIEVAVTAASVNFVDVLIALGRYPSFGGHRPRLGADFAGVVTAVGPGVTQHCVGDRVAGMSGNGCWGTFLLCDAQLACPLSPALTDAQGAAATTASATAWHSLHRLAKLQRGERVLIHSATGGVGHAALGIARAAGAQIFATASSRQRRESLRAMGIKHVYDSRTTEFADLVRRDSGGYGVDVVLNSLTGAGRRAGLNLLSVGGRFVELGRHHLCGGSQSGIVARRGNRAHYGVDLRAMSMSHPEEICELLDTVYWLTANGVLPLPQITHYPLAEAAAAIQVMGAADHTGKLVLDVPHAGRRDGV